MSRVKFRAFHKKEKKMYYLTKGTLEHIEIYSDESWGIKNHHKPSMVKHKNGVLMQSTGLKDKNGKEIFEGDIVKLESHRYLDENDYRVEWINSVITWDKEDCCFKPDKKTNVIFSFKTTEVIGSVHENPELLKEGT